MRLVPIRALRAILVVAVALGLGGVAAHGQQRPAGGGGGPMLIDFRAMTADGKPVDDLKPADLAIRIGGKVRAVTSLELKKIEAAAAPAADAPAEAATDITAPFFTNEPKAAGPAALTRSFLIVVDTDSLPPAAEAEVKASIESLLKGLSARDRVALSTVPRDTAQVGMGTPLARVRDAVNAMKGQRPASVSNEQALCRTAQSLDSIHSLVQQLAANETPTSVIVIASGFSTVDRVGQCEVVQTQYQSIADAAAEGRANVYIVQGDPGTMGRNDGLEQLAGVAGAGQVMRVGGDGFAPRVLADASTYWVATVAPDAADRPGQAQRLEVKVSRDGVTVQARALAAVSRVAPGAGAAQAKPGTTSPKDMIASPAPFTDLQLRAQAIVQRGAQDKFNVIVQAEPVDPTVKINAMRVGYFDQANKGASLDSPKASGYPITTLFAVPSGQYRVRVAATDESGKSGAVDVPIDVSLSSAGPLKVSSLMLGAPQGDNGMKAQLTFTDEQTVLVFLELYGQLTAGISVKFEVAKSDSGPAVDTYPPAGGGPTNEPDKLSVFARIPIDKLAPGDYVVRALVQMEGQPEGKILRTFRKMAK